MVYHAGPFFKHVFFEPMDLTDLSLEELMNIEVTVASGSKQRLSDVPAAVYVITGDEIRRSGHSSVQEALRMVPGFQVSHWTNDMWDVTARGYGNGLSLTNEAFLNQLLVMIDGVPVYSPLFAGVWWAGMGIRPAGAAGSARLRRSPTSGNCRRLGCRKSFSLLLRLSSSPSPSCAPFPAGSPRRSTMKLMDTYPCPGQRYQRVIAPSPSPPMVCP